MPDMTFDQKVSLFNYHADPEGGEPWLKAWYEAEAKLNTFFGW